MERGKQEKNEKGEWRNQGCVLWRGRRRGMEIIWPRIVIIRKVFYRVYLIVWPLSIRASDKSKNGVKISH